MSEQSDRDIEKRFGEIRESFSNHPYGYLITLEKKSDLQWISQILQKPYFPVIKGVKPIEMEVFYSFSKFDEVPRSIDRWYVGFHYEISGVVYHFSASGIPSEDELRKYESLASWAMELLLDENDIRVFLRTPENPDWLFRNRGNFEPARVFGIDVRGLWVDVRVFGTANVQTALDGLMALELELGPLTQE